MTKKDYVRIAAAIRGAWDSAGRPDIRTGVVHVASRIADALKDDNPRFNRTRFYAAALGDEPVKEA